MAGPSAAAVCTRGGQSMGSTRVFMFYKRRQVISRLKTVNRSNTIFISMLAIKNNENDNRFLRHFKLMKVNYQKQLINMKKQSKVRSSRGN
jgi:hypothetical protein